MFVLQTVELYGERNGSSVDRFILMPRPVRELVLWNLK